MRKFAAIFVATSLVCVPEYGLPSYWCLSCFHIWASSLLTSEFKMAENKDGKGGLDVGFFYYDWALSRYRWMDGNCFTKVSGFGPVKKMACSSPEVKAQVGCNCNSVMRAASHFL